MSTLKQLNTKWNSSILIDVTSPHQLELQCSNECIKTSKECNCVERIIFIMKFYSIWTNINLSSSNNKTSISQAQDSEYLKISLSQFINNLKYYSLTQLINDWLHLRQYHWTDINTQYNTRNLFQSIIVKCNDLTKCNIFSRVNRDRAQSKDKEIRKRLYFIKNTTNCSSTESIEVISQQICDSIHDAIFHTPISFLPQFTDQKSNENDDKKSDINSINTSKEFISPTKSEDESSMDASAFEMRNNAIKQLENGQKYFKNSKFVTNLTENKINEERKEDNTMSSYEFGIEMMYTERYKQYAKHKSLKEEILENTNKCCLCIDQWEDTLNKAKQYVNCIKGKLIKSTMNEPVMNININDGASVNALVSCLLYTNFTELQKGFSASTRRFGNEIHKTDKDIRIEHYKQYFHWGQILMITIKCFGEMMTEKKAFYHGIDTELVFADFIAYFNSPTSTTISLSIASSFASTNGIILKLSGRVGVKTKTKYMNVSWFSDYQNEEERLFYGYHNEMEIVSIFKGNFDYKRFIRALKLLDIITDPTYWIVSGGKKYAKLDTDKRSKYCDHLLSMIKKTVNINQYNKELEEQIQNKDKKRKHWKTKDIPDYMMNIFNYFTKRQIAISVDLSRFSNLHHAIIEYFIIKNNIDDHCINLPMLNKLFPNAKSFRFHFGSKVLNHSQLEYLCDNVSNILNSAAEMSIDIIECRGLEHDNWAHVKKSDIKRMQKQYFPNGKYEIKVGRSTVGFIINSNNTPRYESIFIGNLHEIDDKDGTLKHQWTMFISTSKDKLIVPKSIKAVIYLLDSKLYKKSEIKVSKTPFNLKRKGLNVFEVKVKIIFRGKRKNLIYFHTLDFDHVVTISNRTLKQGKDNNIFYSDNIRKYDYWSCRRTDGGLGIID